MRRKIGSYLRKNHPGLYSYYLKIISGPPSFYVLDYLGGSFKDYFLKENMQERIAALKQNLDDYSKQTVDTLINRILNYPERKFNVRMKVKEKDVIGGLLDEERPENQKKVNKALTAIHKNYVIQKALMESSVFYYHHGLTFVPEQVKDYIKGNDFIDLGAYIGDSALALHQYDYKKIYSVEMSRESMQKYVDLMRENNIANYELINSAVAASDDLPPITLTDTGDSNLFSGINMGVGGIIVEQKSLDKIVKEHGIMPKLIKADIEGYSLELVKGAVNTLRQYRPVLAISIYHNPYEFFEVKPYLENILDNYTYLIRKLTISPFTGGCHGEVTLIAYPGEILENYKSSVPKTREYI
jgi:FkbM family methyltransferase